MAMVGVDSGSLQADLHPKSFGLSEGRRPLGAVLHSSNEPRELSQWFCHDDSTINIVLELLLLLLLLLLSMQEPVASRLAWYRHSRTERFSLILLSTKISGWHIISCPFFSRKFYQRWHFFLEILALRHTHSLNWIHRSFIHSFIHSFIDITTLRCPGVITLTITAVDNIV